MKKIYFLFVGLLFAATLLAQRNPQNADRTAQPPFDPSQLNDFQAPVVNCLNDIQVGLTTFSGTVQIWTTDVLLSVSDNLTPLGEIKIGMRKAGTGTDFPWEAPNQPANSVIFGCDDIEQPVAVELWAMDAAGNTAMCESVIDVWDPWSVCNSNNLDLTVCARSYCSQEGIEEATYLIDGTGNFIPPFTYFVGANDQGCLEIPNNMPIASTFSIRVEKDDNPLNGVSSADLVLLSQHIHGIQPFTEPWQWVAADINRDWQITIEDSIELQKLILGIYTELPNNTSWRFIPSGYQFPSPNPLSQPYPDSLLIETVLLDTDTLFLGVKIGDLNCSAVNFAAPPQADRTAPPPYDPTQLDGPPTETSTTVVEVCVGTENQCGLEELDFEFDGENPGGLFIIEDISNEPGGICPYRYKVPVGSNLEITPVKDDNPLNGVTTYDLVLISKHIRGIEPFNSPYKIIAADADKNGVLDLNDSIQLSKLILGIYTELPNNTSWRFVRKDYIFPNPANPFAEIFPETYSATDIQSTQSADFVAIKVGDVNGTAVCNSLTQGDDRTLQSEIWIGTPLPNPAADRCELPVFVQEGGVGEMMLADLSGRVLWNQKWLLQPGAQRIQFPMEAIQQPGIYLWRIQIGDQIKSGKIGKI
ncbi:MAG: hypothetical protein SFV22_12460 [Saprospiraceae bacterium]|nr:hypothetical protein [Saprospiraceae bacterium]